MTRTERHIWLNPEMPTSHGLMSSSIQRGHQRTSRPGGRWQCPPAVLSSSLRARQIRFSWSVLPVLVEADSSDNIMSASAHAQCSFKLFVDMY